MSGQIVAPAMTAESQRYSVEFKSSCEAHIIVDVSLTGEETQPTFVAPGETITLLLPCGLAGVQLVATDLGNPDFKKILDAPPVELVSRINHRNVISIEKQGHKFQLSGGPAVGVPTSEWKALKIDSNFDFSAKIHLLPRMVSHTPDTGDKIARFARNNKAILITSTVFGVAGAVLLPIALPLLGFGASGVVAGSIAAGAQSAIYGGFTGGVFSVLQSMGAAGVSAGATAMMTAFGVATGAGIGALIKEEILHTIPISRIIRGETKIEINYKAFQILESVTIVTGKDGEGKLKAVFISTFGRSEKIYRYRFEFTKSANDFEIQVPQTSADNWREFFPIDFDKINGQELENIYVLKPRA